MTRPIDEPLTGRRQGDTVGRLTEENTDAELGFQFLQRGTDGGCEIPNRADASVIEPLSATATA